MSRIVYGQQTSQQGQVPSPGTTQGPAPYGQSAGYPTPQNVIQQAMPQQAPQAPIMGPQPTYSSMNVGNPNGALSMQQQQQMAQMAQPQVPLMQPPANIHTMRNSVAGPAPVPYAPGPVAPAQPRGIPAVGGRLRQARTTGQPYPMPPQQPMPQAPQAPRAPSYTNGPNVAAMQPSEVAAGPFTQIPPSNQAAPQQAQPMVTGGYAQQQQQQQTQQYQAPQQVQQQAQQQYQQPQQAQQQVQQAQQAQQVSGGEYYQEPVEETYASEQYSQMQEPDSNSILEQQQQEQEVNGPVFHAGEVYGDEVNQYMPIPKGTDHETPRPQAVYGPSYGQTIIDKTTGRAIQDPYSGKNVAVNSAVGVALAPKFGEARANVAGAYQNRRSRSASGSAPFGQAYTSTSAVPTKGTARGYTAQ